MKHLMQRLPNLFLWVVVIFLAHSCNAPTPKTDIVVTLKPIHAIILALTAKTELTVQLLGGGITSPHDYALKPSDMALLSHAKTIILVSPLLERFIDKALKTLPNQKSITLLDIKGLTLLPSGNHGHKHAHEKITAPDFHIWLDPLNVEVITRALQKRLGALFPDHTSVIEQNAIKLTSQLRTLDQTLKQQLSSVKKEGFMVYHNAYRYFEHRYHLNNKGSVTLSSHTLPGTQHIVGLRNKLKQGKIRCLFIEPGPKPPLVNILTENTNVKVASLSALGNRLKPSDQLYFQLMKGLAQGYKSCLER